MKNLVLSFFVVQFFLTVSVSLFVVPAAQAESQRVNRENFVLFMPEVKHAENRLFVIVPGALKTAAQYEALAARISADSRVGIWTAVLKMPLSMPNIAPLSPRVAEIVSYVQNFGVNIDFATTFVGGHSLGGVVAQNYAFKNPVGGLVLLASYVTRSNRDRIASYEFPLPILTLGGEIDGKTRITRIAQEVELTRDAFSNGNVSEIVRMRPVVVLPGVNHSDFADGVLMSGDLNSEVGYADSQASIASVVSDFIVLNTASFADTLAEQRMESRVESTIALTAGYLNSQKVSSQWCSQSQQKIAIGFGTLPITQSEASHLPDFVLSKPQIHEGGVQTSVHFNTVWNPLDISTFAEQADAIDCKMKNAQALEGALGRAPTERGVQSCRELNEQAFRSVIGLLSASTQKRFAEKGVALDFAADKEFKTGFQWVSSGLSFERKGERVAIVASPFLFTDLNAPQQFAGMFYCKLMSPARIAEWIMIDGLR